MQKLALYGPRPQYRPRPSLNYSTLKETQKYDLGLGKNFLNMTSKAQVIKDKDNMDFNSIKNFGAANDIRKVKENPKNGRRYLQIIHLIKILRPEYINHTLLQLNNKNTIILLKTGQKF